MSSIGNDNHDHPQHHHPLIIIVIITVDHIPNSQHQGNSPGDDQNWNRSPMTFPVESFWSSKSGQTLADSTAAAFWIPGIPKNVASKPVFWREDSEARDAECAHPWPVAERYSPPKITDVNTLELRGAKWRKRLAMAQKLLCRWTHKIIVSCQCWELKQIHSP